MSSEDKEKTTEDFIAEGYLTGSIPGVINHTRYHTEDLQYAVARAVAFGHGAHYWPNRDWGGRRYVLFKHSPASGLIEEGRPYFVRTSRVPVPDKQPTFSPFDVWMENVEGEALKKIVREHPDRPSTGAAAAMSSRSVAKLHSDKSVAPNLLHALLDDLPWQVRCVSVITLPAPVRTGSHLSGLRALDMMKASTTMSLPPFVNEQIAAWLHRHVLAARNYRSYNRSLGTLMSRFTVDLSDGDYAIEGDDHRIRFSYDRVQVADAVRDAQLKMVTRMLSYQGHNKVFRKRTELNDSIDRLKRAEEFLKSAQSGWEKVNAESREESAEMALLQLKNKLPLTSDNGSK